MITWREPEVKTLYPLTHPQRRIWYTEQLNPDTGLFNIGGFLRIKGKVEPTIMQQAARMMIERNEGLRLHIVNEDGEPKQYLREVVDLHMDFYDYRSKANPLEAALDWTKKETARLFTDGELVDVALVQIADEDFIYLQKCHHILSDGWAFSVLKSELNKYYTAIANAEGLESELPPSYLEYLQDEAEYRESNRFQKNRDFWLENFQNLPQAATLSAKMPSSRQTKGVRYRVDLDEALTQQINQYVKDASSSVYTFFMAVFFAYLQRVSGAHDLIIGTPVLNRGNARQKNTVGMFVSTMPFRVQVDDQSTFVEFLKQILDGQRTYYRHQRYPMDLLVKDLELSKKGNQKLFEHSVSYQNSVYDPHFYGAPVELDWIFNGHEENSLTLHINDRMDRGELILEFDYALDAFDEGDIQRISRHLLNMAKAVLSDSTLPLSRIPYMDRAEEELITRKWNETQAPYPADKCIYQLIEEQAQATPEALAVVDGERKLTYRELNSLANHLARVLREQGIVPDSRVGLFAERALETVVGILGVLKAGGAYIPIDPDYPEERSTYMLEDSESRVLLTQSHLLQRIPGGYRGEIIVLDQFVASTTGDAPDLEPLATPENMCYIIYTSGSTGRPKGVMIEHRGLMNYIWWAGHYYCPDMPANFPLYSSLSFDLTVTSIFVPLTKGSTIYVVGTDRENLISKVMKMPEINIVKLTPAHLALVKEEDNRASSVRKFILGGEELKTDISRAAVASFGGNLEIYNEYGPTETVVGCIIYRFNEADERSSVLIGKPVHNTQIYILDPHRQPVGVGIVGEIFIAGDGVARGYLNRPELTEEKFVPDPFRPGKRMYRSGDLGRYLPDGNMEYLGRVDTQVKIRGYRIEIGEVESALQNIPGITQAVVMDRTDQQGSKYLAGYYVAENELATTELRSHLLKKLPEYMVPAHFMRLDVMPLNTNGKVDRKRLPEIEVTTRTEYVAPTNEMEAIIAEVWAGVLGFEQVGINDNFFELGGDSIKAIQVSTRLKNRGIRCQVQDIFTYHTVGQVALHVTTDVEEIKAEQGIVEGEIALTPIMQWFFSRKLTQPEYWNQSVLLGLAPAVELPLLEKALQKLVEQHDALRLNYDQATGQMYHENAYLDQPVTVASVDLRDLGAEEQDHQLRHMGASLKAGFALAGSLYIKAVVFELGARGRRLLITIHHLAVDGVSWRILLEELAQNYLALQNQGEITLPRKTTSYKEWADALQEYSQSEKLEKEISYWEETLAGCKLIAADVAVTAGDYGTVAETGTAKVLLPAEETNLLLTKANEAYNTQINDLLLTALICTFREQNGEDSLSLRLEGHGREELFQNYDLSRTVGWFTSIYPVCLNLNGRKELADQIKGVKEQLRKIPEKGIGYGIIKYLRGHQFPVDEEAVTGILFNYLGQFDADLQNELFSFADEATGPELGALNRRNSLIEFNCMVVRGQLEVAVNYSKRHLKEETIQKMLDSYSGHLRQVIEHCSSGENFGFTPSDFDTVELSEEDLDSLFF